MNLHLTRSGEPLPPPPIDVVLASQSVGHKYQPEQAEEPIEVCVHLALEEIPVHEIQVDRAGAGFSTGDPVPLRVAAIIEDGRWIGRLHYPTIVDTGLLDRLSEFAGRRVHESEVELFPHPVG